MIGLDTNVLIRYLVRDDARQTKAATKLIESQCTPDDPGFLCSVVLCELIWVLDRGYGYDRRTIAFLLNRLLAAEELQIEYSEAAWQALGMYETGKADFSGYLIGIVHKIHKAEITYTFDRDAAESSLFKLISKEG